MNPSPVIRALFQRQRSSTLLFAILVTLAIALGDVGQIVSFLALASQNLVVAATLAGVLAIKELYRPELAVLRALGATRGYIFLVIWGYVTLFVLAGAILGLLLGTAVAKETSTAFTDDTGITLAARHGQKEFFLAAGLVLTGSILALPPLANLPSPHLRQPPLTVWCDHLIDFLTPSKKEPGVPRICGL